LYILGRAYGNLGSPEKAIEVLRRAVALHSSAPYYSELGRELDKTGDQMAALKAFARAIELDGKYAEAHFGIARVLTRLGRAEEAMRHLHRAVDLDPEFQEAYYLLASVYRRAHDPMKAELYMKHFERIKIATSRRSSLTTGFVSGK
jgi:tetratricopeptide (TPR) repeat protein